MAFDAEQREFQRLSSVFRNESDSIIPFVGAGLSIYGSTEQRLPLWGQLVRGLLETGVARTLLDSQTGEKIEHLLRHGRLIAATDLILNHLGRATFQQEISAALSIEDREVPPAIKKLIEISWSFMITTNLDQFIERAWMERYAAQLRVITHHNRTELMRIVSGVDRKRAPVLAKLHGSIEFPESWVLDSNAYRSLVDDGRSSYAEALRNLLLQNVFFVGYGMSDMDFDILLDQISMIFPYGVGTAYALLSREHEGSEKMRGVFRNAGVRPIWYDVHPERKNSPDAGHSGVVECLTLLVGAWRQGKGKPRAKWLGLPTPGAGFEGREAECIEFIEKLESRDCLGIQVVGSAGAGKTTFVRKVLSDDLPNAGEAGIDGIFGVSFDRYDRADFVNNLYNFVFADDPATPSHGVDEEFKVRKICQQLSQKRYIVTLDGLEKLLDKDGQICDPAISRIAMAISVGDSFLVCTSRKRICLNLLHELVLRPFHRQAIRSMSSNRDVSSKDLSATSAELFDRIESHALGVKLALALDQDGVSKLDFSTQDVAADSGGAFTAQLLTVVLDMLSPREEALLLCIALSQKPVPLLQVLDLFQEDHGSPEVNGWLVGVDLREPLQSLIKKTLVQIEGENRIGLHPLVHEVMSRRLSARNTTGLHSAIADYLIKQSERRFPETFQDCETYFDICYHLSAAQEWTKFHDIYYRVLNREHENFLGNVLGSWDAYRRTAELAFRDFDANEQAYPSTMPSYYLSCVARAYKHLGEPVRATTFYRRCLRTAILERSSECARYANNFFSLLSLHGRMDEALSILKLNFSTLEWIEEDWQRCWQEEYALNSAAYFFGLTGFKDEAIAYFEYAEGAWSRRGLKRETLFDYYRVYQVEIRLSKPKTDFEAVEHIATSSIQAGLNNSWIETEVTGRCALASIRRRRANDYHSIQELQLANEDIQIALCRSADSPLPRLRVIVLLEAIRLNTCAWKFNPEVSFVRDLETYLDEAKEIAANSSLELYGPELFAAQGWLDLIKGDKGAAEIAHTQAMKYCDKLGTTLYAESRNYLLASLSNALGLSANLRSRFASPPDPVSLLNPNATPEDLLALVDSYHIQSV